MPANAKRTEIIQKTIDKLHRDLSGEEKEVIRHGFETVRFHSRTGAVIGAVLGTALSRFRRPNPSLMRYLFFSIGSGVLGFQVGVTTGTVRSMSYIRQLPNPEHLSKAFREAQMEMMSARNSDLAKRRRGSQVGNAEENFPTSAGDRDEMTSAYLRDQPWNDDDSGIISDEQVVRDTRRNREPQNFQQTGNYRAMQPPAQDDAWGDIRRQTLQRSASDSARRSEDSRLSQESRPSKAQIEFAADYEREQRGGEPGERTDDTTLFRDADEPMRRQRNDYGDEY